MKNIALILATLSISITAIAEEATWTTGTATVVNDGLIDCGRGTRTSAVGNITSDDGTVWTVPAQTLYTTAPKATDMFNECDGIKYTRSSDVDLNAVPVVDAGGNDLFTAYIFADNYFELYVNGTLVAVDPVPFTPFNSNVVRFSAQRPITVAFKMVDWEETLGLGVEAGRGSKYHPGDGGLVAHIKDSNQKTVAITDDNWRAQTFYIAPVSDRNCLKIDGTNRDSSDCSTNAVKDISTASAAHWAIPDTWAQPDFDDSEWPNATIFSNDTVGVNNKKAYTSFTDIFDAGDADARFIWSSNLILDNLVLLRSTIQ